MKEKKNVFLSTLRHLFLNHWLFKLISVMLSIALWAVLVSRDTTLTREKVISDVTVSVSGLDTLRRNGFVVTSDLTSQLSGFTISANVPQNVYNDATASRYSLRADLSKITEAGQQQLKITAGSSSAYGAVTSIEPQYIDITIEEYTTRYRVPVSMEIIGSAPEGFYATTPSYEPATVTVSGPQSVVSNIVRAEITVDQSVLPARPGTVRTGVSYRLVDIDGNIVDSNMLEVTNGNVLLDSIITEQTLYPSRKLDLNDIGLITGTPADGYEISSVTVSPRIITAASANSETLNALEALYTDSSVDVTGKAESFTATVKVRRPSDMAYLSPDSVTVAVEIVPIIVEREFEKLKINVVGQQSGMTALLSSSNINATVRGEKLLVDALKAKQIVLKVDVSGLEAGIHMLPVQAEITDADGQSFTVDVPSVEVNIKNK